MKCLMAGTALLLLAGCSGGVQANQNNQTEAENALNIAVPANPPMPDKGMVISRKDNILEFTYKWPAAAVAIAPLNVWLQSHADGQYATARKEAEEGRRAAKKNGFPFNAYSYEQSWSVVADTADVLILESSGYAYTGGAHGMPFAASLIWDRAAGKKLAMTDVIDPDKLAAASRESFCGELNRQREEKRGEPVVPGAKDAIPEFNLCPAMKEQEIIPVSRKGKALDAIRVVIGPYVAGPYVEGTYEIELPMTQTMLAGIKPAYRGWFSTGTP